MFCYKSFKWKGWWSILIELFDIIIRRIYFLFFSAILRKKNCRMRSGKKKIWTYFWKKSMPHIANLLSFFLQNSVDSRHLKQLTQKSWLFKDYHWQSRFLFQKLRLKQKKNKIKLATFFSDFSLLFVFSTLLFLKNKDSDMSPSKKKNVELICYFLKKFYNLIISNF